MSHTPLRNASRKAFVGPLLAQQVETPIGAMIAAADGNALVLLEFTGDGAFEKALDEFGKRLGRVLEPGDNPVLASAILEVTQYFERRLTDFRTPVELHGTPFQRTVWRRLTEIPYGETISYHQLAREIGAGGAQRAVGRANGSNPLAVIVPCHRVIRADGSLSGYGGGIWRKRWLLDHEQRGEPRGLRLL